MKLFVYGTLQKGYWNNTFLNGATFLSEGITLKSFILWHGGFPIATHNQEIAQKRQVKMLPVWGQLFELDEHTLRRCDSLEGHPDWYCRQLTPINGTDGRVHEAWMYSQDQYEGNKLCNTMSLDNDLYYRWDR